MKKKRKFKPFFALLGVLFLGIGSWAIYSLLNQGAMDILAQFGIDNFYLQTTIVIVFVLLFFILSGTSLWKAFERLIKG